MPNHSPTVTGRPCRHRGGRRVAALVSAIVAASILGAQPSAGAAPAAPVRGRVDLDLPRFSDPTRITNPRFPITRTRQMISLGHEAGTELRQETTLLARTRTFGVGGKRIETVASQFVGYGDGAVMETAVDYFAQADDGSVWYFGEDVTNYEDGRVVDHDGSWLAGRDGPPGMIMPAHPEVGDVYRPENIPGLVFEETTVMATDLTVSGPSGAISGAIRVEEHPADGDVETKVYAPGYGEFEAVVPASEEFVRAAVGVPTDVRHRAEPSSLVRLSDAAADIRRHARRGSLTELRHSNAAIHAAMRDVARTHPAPLLEAQMRDRIAALDTALGRRDRTALAFAALAVEQAALDLELQYTDARTVDRDRLRAWKRQRRLHARDGDRAGVSGDRVIIAAIADRLVR